jgi:hypothetical protein
MFTLYSTQELHDFVINRLSTTSIDTGHYQFIGDALQDFNTPFGESMVQHCEENVNTIGVLDMCLKRINTASHRLAEEFGQEYADEFELVRLRVEEMEKNQSTTRARYLPVNDAVAYFKSIKSPVGGAIKCLVYSTGVLPNDLLRSTTNLRNLRNGVLEVGSGYIAGHTKSRAINFDPSLLNELDPEGELIDVLIEKVNQTTADNLGKQGLSLSHYYQDNVYDLYSLRNSHAVNLLNEGVDERTVADIQGCKDLKRFRTRIKDFKRNAGIE